MSQEELAAEAALAKVPSKDELRAAVITEFGFDETEDEERITKLVDQQFDQRTKLSQAVGAKIKHRNDANELRTKVAVEPTPVTPVVPPKPPEEKKDDLTPTDLYALMQAQVPQEDVDVVKSAAKALGISITDALKDDIVKGKLSQLKAHRDTANAANTAPARPGSKKVTGEQVLADAAKGIIPDKGTDEAEELFWAKRGGRPAAK